MNGPLIRQRRSADCGIAALAFYRGLPYEDVYLAAALACPYWVRYGMRVKDIENTAKKLGTPLRRVHARKVDLDEDSGVLTLVWNTPQKQNGWRGHIVVLRRGVIVDPAEPSVVDADDYMELNDARVGTLLVEA